MSQDNVVRDSLFNDCTAGNGASRQTWHQPSIGDAQVVAKPYERRTAELVNDWIRQYAPDSGVEAVVFGRETKAQHDMYILRDGLLRSRIELEHKLKAGVGDWAFPKVPRRYGDGRFPDGNWDGVNILLRKVAPDFDQAGAKGQTSAGWLKFNKHLTGFVYVRWDAFEQWFRAGEVPLVDTVGSYQMEHSVYVENTGDRVYKVYWETIDRIMSEEVFCPGWIATDEHYGVCQFGQDVDCERAQMSLVEEFVLLASGPVLRDARFEKEMREREECRRILRELEERGI